MTILLEGISLGLILCVMVGPIFFSILQTSIERGAMSGAALAAGQWLGDLMYIALVFWGAQYIDQVLQDPAAKQTFTWYLGTIGSCILGLFGLSMWLSKASVKPEEQVLEAPRSNSHWGRFLQGFLINTVNPFPLFFWASLMGTALSKGYNTQEAGILFGSVMGTVIGTDLLKIYLAKRLSRWIKPQYLIYIRRGAGTALMIFALLLWYNTR